MIAIIAAHIIPAAYAVLPSAMASPQATAQLLAIGSQESQFVTRRQKEGPARGFWQFEAGGIRGVLTHDRTADPIRAALQRLCYREPYESADLLTVIEHNDVAAACFARCLLFTSPRNLPEPNDVQESWLIYLATWRPGRPRQATWDANYAGAWARVRASGDPRDA